MLSYDKWKTISEGVLGGPMTLGFGKPATVLGVMGSRGGTEAAREVADLEALEEAKKKMKKKMFGGGDDEDMDMADDDGGDDEKVIDVGDGDDDDMDSDDGECMGKKCGKGMKKKSKKESIEYEALQAEMKMMGKKMDKMGGKLAFLKGKNDDHDHDGDDHDDDDGDDKAMPFKKKDKGCKDKMENLSTDDRAFWNSFSSMTDINLNAKHWDGISVREDQLIEPTDDGLQYREPQPGDVGFAPQNKMGAGFTPADDGWKYDA